MPSACTSTCRSIHANKLATDIWDHANVSACSLILEAPLHIQTRSEANASMCVGGRPAQLWQEALKGALECEIIQCHPRNTPGLRGDKTDVSWWAGGKYKPVCIIRMPQKLVALRRSEVGAIMHASYTCCSLMPSRGVCEIKCENKQTVSACEEQGTCMHVRPIAAGGY